MVRPDLRGNIPLVKFPVRWGRKRFRYIRNDLIAADSHKVILQAEFCASSAVCEKLASNDDFEIVVRQIENLEAHIFKISVSICLSKHCPYLVIETFHRGIGYVPETPESQDPVPIL